MSKVEKVLIVALGSIGKRHLYNLKKLFPQIELAVLRSSEEAVEDEGIVVFTNIDSALRFAPQAALICSPSSLHLKTAIALAKNGIHLFIEKPLSNSLQGVVDFIELSRRANIKIMLGYNLRFSRSLIEFKALLDSGVYGRALSLSSEVGQYLPDWRPDTDYRVAVSARAEYGGGALLELSHELDYLLWIFGEVEFVSGQILRVSDLHIDVEDLVLAQMCFNNSGIRLYASLHLDFLQRRPNRQCKVICEEAPLIWDAIADRVEIQKQKAITIAFQGDKNINYTYEQELIQFVECIEENKKVPISVEDGMQVLKLAEAMKTSSDTGAVVNL
jgi:predicted dehydrogenase